MRLVTLVFYVYTYYTANTQFRNYIYKDKVPKHANPNIQPRTTCLAAKAKGQ